MLWSKRWALVVATCGILMVLHGGSTLLKRTEAGYNRHQEGLWCIFTGWTGLVAAIFRSKGMARVFMVLTTATSILVLHIARTFWLEQKAQCTNYATVAVIIEQEVIIEAFPGVLLHLLGTSVRYTVDPAAYYSCIDEHYVPMAGWVVKWVIFTLLCLCSTWALIRDVEEEEAEDIPYTAVDVDGKVSTVYETICTDSLVPVEMKQSAPLPPSSQ